MNKQELIDLLSKERFSAEDQKYIEGLKERYPWFGLAKFIDLKIDNQMGNTQVDEKVNKAVVFSSDRKFLYNWINNEVKPGKLLQHSTTELEFIDDSELIDEIAAAEPVHDESLDEGAELPVPGENTIKESIEQEETDRDQILEDTIIAEASEDGEEPPVPVEDPLSEIESSTSLEDETDRDESGDEKSQGNTDEIEVVVEKEDSELDHPELEEEDIPVPFIDNLDEEEEIQQEIDEQEGSISEALIQQEDDIEHDAEDEYIPAPEVVADIDSILKASLSKEEGPVKEKAVNLIEQFLQNEPSVIKGDAETGLKGDISEKSVKEDDGYITDTLAKIYVKQGLHAKAIYAYERLSLKYPEKSAYFAAQIEKIKSISNL